MKHKLHILYLLRLVCRYYIAYQMFSYAFGKILKTQFDLGVSLIADENINNYNGFMLTWNYFGYSRSYGLFIAGAQITAAFLLLFRKTERLGTVLFLSFMVNILLIDIFYEIDGALWMAILLNLLGFFLLLSDWKGFKYYFLKTTDNIPLIPNILPAKFKPLYFGKFLVVGILIFMAYQGIADIKNNHLKESEFYGIWRNASGYKADRIHKLFIDYFNQIKLKDFERNIYYGDIELDTLNHTMRINAQHYGDEAYYFIEDSIQKLATDTPNEEIKKNIRNYYNKLNNSLPFENVFFEYELIGDTLYLKTNTQETIKFVEVSKDYIKE